VASKEVMQQSAIEQSIEKLSFTKQSLNELQDDLPFENVKFG